ncbi:MAG TPA: transporter [Rhodopirellula sp.]|nr:transporter [Rhodopirellula sp.]
MCAVALAGLPGCRSYRNLPETVGNRTDKIDSLMRRVDAGAPAESITELPAAPFTLKRPEDLDAATYRDMTLDKAIRLAIENGEVLRKLGGMILTDPERIYTEQTIPLQVTDPQTGIEAALSAFDANLYAFGRWQNNDRRYNNQFISGGANAFQQDTHDYVLQMSKYTATGAQLAVRSITDYDANNATGNITPSVWQTQFQAEVRQPLLQGGGLTFNRIAGPSSVPGNYNGVLIAKVNNDLTAAEFRQQLRDYISDVITAYWDLYFAYRSLDSKRDALQRSQTTWQSFAALKNNNRRTGTDEAMAREQYYRFKSEVNDAISGQLGVQTMERNLRLLIGISITDGVLIRPADEPNEAPLVFDWDSIAIEAVQLRSELQQTRLKVKRSQMEVLAAKNFLMPELDLVSTYRIRGLGKHLAGSDSAFGELGSGDYQEYEASVELRMPVGFRQAHAAVRNAQLKVQRQNTLLREQERRILRDLTNDVVECDRAYVQMQTNMNRYLAATDALKGMETNRDNGLPISLEQLLDAQRRASEAQTKYYLSLSQYAIATKNVQYQQGTLLHAIHLMVLEEPPESISMEDILPETVPTSAPTKP